MDQPLLVVELGVGLLVVVLVCFVAFTWWRRIRIAGGHSTAVCTVRQGDDARPAIMRMGPRALEFHGLWGLGTTPYLALRRTTIDLEWLDEAAPRATARWVRLTGDQAGAGARPAGAEVTLDVALPPGDGRALRAWQETLPPGHSVALGL